MLQIEIFENRDRSPLLCGGFPVCQRYTRRQKSLLYSFPLSPSSSGQGRHPFKVDIAGSNPAGGTTESEKPVALAVTGFFLPQRRDSNPTGCGSRQIGGKTGFKASFSNKKPGPARCGPRLNTVTICQLHSTRRTGCRRRSGPASSRRPRSPPWHPRRRAAYPWRERPRVHTRWPAPGHRGPRPSDARRRAP